RKHRSSRNCAAPWPTPTPTVAAPPSSSSKRTAGIRQCSRPREGNVPTSPTLADTTPHASRRTYDGPGQGMPTSHWTEPCGGRRPADNPSIPAGVRRRGIDVRLNTTLEEATGSQVRLSDGTSVPTRTLVWAVGVTPGPLAQVLGLGTVKGRIVV